MLQKLLRLSWPIVLARATQSVVGFCDALMVAPLGEEPLAAATTGALNTFAVIILPMGTVYIVQSFAAQLRGRGDLRATRRYAWYGLALALAAGVIGALCIPLVPAVLGLFDYAPGVHEQMSRYLTIRLWSVGAVVGTEALGNWYAGLGNTHLSMIAGIIVMVANVFGNWLLIEPRFGLPGYGIDGAALASVIASFIGFGVTALAFAKSWGIDVPAARTKLSLRELARVLRFGLPNGMNWFLEFAAFMLFINAMVSHLGTSVLAAFNVVMQINSLSFMPAFGISSAGAILVGEAIGSGHKPQVSRIVRVTAAVSATWMVSIGLLYLVAPRALMQLFDSGEAETSTLLSAGVLMLKMAAVWQLFDALVMTLSEALRAAGDTAFCMWMRIVLAWGIFMPVAYVLMFPLGGGVLTMMLTLIGYMVLLALAFYLRFASGRWRNIELLEDDLLGAEELPKARLQTE